MAPAEYLSGAWRLGLAAGYAALLAVNGVYGSGAFGVPTNADISGAYPSPVTPARTTVLRSTAPSTARASISLARAAISHRSRGNAGST